MSKATLIWRSEICIQSSKQIIIRRLIQYSIYGRTHRKGTCLIIRYCTLHVLLSRSTRHISHIIAVIPVRSLSHQKFDCVCMPSQGSGHKHSAPKLKPR